MTNVYSQWFWEPHFSPHWALRTYLRVALVLICCDSRANNWITSVRLCLLAPGEDDIPAAVRHAVHRARGGVAVQWETKGGATARTGHAAETEGNTHTLLTLQTYLAQILLFFIDTPSTHTHTLLTHRDYSNHFSTVFNTLNFELLILCWCGGVIVCLV